MSLGRLLGFIAGVALFFYIVHVARDPHRTDLPFGTTDLSSVEGALRKLPADERALVESYVKRSNGDVLPPNFADPDNPFTARTFAEAIALEKNWNVKMRAQQAIAEAHAAARDAALASLRDAVEARVVRSEVIPLDEFDARLRAPSGGAATGREGAKVAIGNNAHDVFVVTVAISNHTDSEVVRLQGALEAKDRDAYLPLQLCWVDLGEQRTISAHGQLEITCGNRNFIAKPDERAFVAGAPGRFDVVWNPKLIKLASGKTLSANQ